MKQLQKNIRRVAIALCALFALLVVWGVYSLTTYGSRWFASSANTFMRTRKKDVIAGDILDRNGIVLATTVNGQRMYQNDLNARKATVHTVGDSGSNVNNSAESFFASYLYGFNSSFLERLSFAIRGEQRRGDTVQLTAVLPAGTESAIKWQSSNKKVATVSSTGLVTFKKPGKATITATAVRGKKKGKVKVKVTK